MDKNTDLTITCYLDDVFTGDYVSVQRTVNPHIFLRYPESIQATFLDSMEIELKNTYPDIIGGSIFKFELPDDFERFEPAEPFDKRLKSLYDNSNPFDDILETLKAIGK